ncbi:MAG: sensor histidine kinase [Candidatus Udaeobacter sp.]
MVGIPPKCAPNVFNRFYRAPDDEQTPGHGLALSIARELARAHGGDVTLTRAESDWILSTTERLERPGSNAKTACSGSRVAPHIPATADSVYPFTRRRKKEAG